MNLQNKFFLLGLALFAFSACIKTEIIPEVLEPKISVEPASLSLTPGQSYQLNGIYTDEAGKDQSALIQWKSAAPAIASVSSGGLATAQASGQSWIVATAPGGLSDSVLVTITDNSNAVANVVIITTQTVLEVGSTRQLTAKACNAANQELPSSIVTWSSSDPTVLTISADGIASGLSVGTAVVTAAVAGVISLPVAFQVTAVGGASRTGTFSGNMGYAVAGTATLQQTGSDLKLVLGGDFQASNGPQLGVYLAKTASGGLNSQNSLKLANLLNNSGMQTYDVPAGVGLNDYNYVVIYCIPFNVRFGTAQLNN